MQDYTNNDYDSSYSCDLDSDILSNDYDDVDAERQREEEIGAETDIKFE